MDEITWIKLIIDRKFKKYQELKIICNYSGHIVHDSFLKFLSWMHKRKMKSQKNFYNYKKNWFFGPKSDYDAQQSA